MVSCLFVFWHLRIGPGLVRDWLAAVGLDCLTSDLMDHIIIFCFVFITQRQVITLLLCYRTLDGRINGCGQAS